MLPRLFDTAYAVFGAAKLWAEQLFVPPPANTPARLAIEAKLDEIRDEMFTADDWAIVPESVAAEWDGPLAKVFNLTTEQRNRRVDRQPRDVNGGACCPVVYYDFTSYDGAAG